jgi:hypothetical protein
MRAALLLTVVSLTISGCDQLKPVPSLLVGRYTIIHSPQVERDTMLLDTATGDTWQLVNLGKDENTGQGWQFTAKLDGPPKNSN